MGAVGPGRFTETGLCPESLRNLEVGHGRNNVTAADLQWSPRSRWPHLFARSPNRCSRTRSSAYAATRRRRGGRQSSPVPDSNAPTTRRPLLPANSAARPLIRRVWDTDRVQDPPMPQVVATGPFSLRRPSLTARHSRWTTTERLPTGCLMRSRRSRTGGGRSGGPGPAAAGERRPLAPGGTNFRKTLQNPLAQWSRIVDH